MKYRAWYLTRGGRSTWKIVEADNYVQALSEAKKGGSNLQSIKPLRKPEPSRPLRDL